MSSADAQVINMVNSPHERRKQLQERTKAAKRERERRARERSRRAGVVNRLLWLVMKVEVAILWAAVIVIILAH